MFRKKREYHKRNSFLPMVIFRMALSLTMFLVLGLGIYQAYKYFTGADPLKLDPKALVLSLVSSEESIKLVNTIFGVKVPAGVSEKLGQKVDSPKASGKLTLKFAVVADSHNNNENLAKALSLAKKEGAKFVVGLGDYSDVGTMEELEKAKEVFQSSGLPYYVTAGDHDLWDARDKSVAPIARFNEIFGSPYQSFSDSNIRFIILYNSDNYLGMGDLQLRWLQQLLTDSLVVEDKKVFVFLQEPLYHPSSDHMMGKVTPGLIKQAEEVAALLAQAKVAEVFAGDIHAFSQYDDPKSGLKMTTVGALASERNTQKPRFAIVDVFDGGGYNVRDLELK